MEANVFLRYFETSFLEVIGPERPVLLIYDGHSSHVDDRLIESARSNGVTILKLPPHSSHILQPLDLSVFKSLKVRWDSEVATWQRHHEGKKMPKRNFSSLIGKIWQATSPDIICNGFRKAGIFPFNSGVVSKEQYDPLAYQRWEKHINNPITNQPIPTVDERDQESVQPIDQEPQPGTSKTGDHTQTTSNRPEPGTLEVEEPIQPTSNRPQPGIPEAEEPIQTTSKRSFEELLLSTVKQAKEPEKLKKRKVASGAEVITSDEVMRRLAEKDANAAKPASKKRKKGRAVEQSHQESEEEGEDEIVEGDNEIPYAESDDDIEEELRESEDFAEHMNEITKGPRDIVMYDWVLILLAGKKTKKYFVGQVVSAETAEEDIEVRFTRKVPTLDPMSSSTFSWKSPDECAAISRDDVIITLPKPNIIRRGLIKFDVNFSEYNVQ